MKKILFALIISALVLSATSCTEREQSATSSDSSTVSSVASESAGETLTTVDELKAEILKKIAFDGDMIDCTKLTDYPLDTHSIDGDKYSEYIYYEVSDTTNSYETIIVFAATTDENAEFIKGKLVNYIDSLKAQFGNYNATINKMVEDSVINIVDNKVYLIISPNAAEIEKTITGNINVFK